MRLQLGGIDQRFDAPSPHSLPFGAVDGPSDQRCLVTGALGCIGAWTVKTLLSDGASVVTLDLAGEPKRLRLVMSDEELARVTMVEGDVSDLAAIEQVLDDHDIDHVIHLAALQTPASRADPPLGARVNVVGTVNVLEAVKRRRDRIPSIAYASSIGIYDATDADPADGRLREDAVAHPWTQYGVYKLANEGSARVYWQDESVASVGLRPMTVFGPGRDQGLTSDPTRAILAAVAGRPFEIGFGGRMLFHYAPDVARAFIAASRSTEGGAFVYNVNGVHASIDEFVAAIERHVPGSAGLVTHKEPPLPFPAEIEFGSIGELGDVPVTPLDDAIAATVALFREKIERGELVPEEHGLAS